MEFGLTTPKDAAFRARVRRLLTIPMPVSFVRLAELILIERLEPILNKKRVRSGFGGATYDAAVFGEVLGGPKLGAT